MKKIKRVLPEVADKKKGVSQDLLSLHTVCKFHSRKSNNPETVTGLWCSFCSDNNNKIGINLIATQFTTLTVSVIFEEMICERSYVKGSLFINDSLLSAVISIENASGTST